MYLLVVADRPLQGPEFLVMWFSESEANVRDVFNKAHGHWCCSLCHVLQQIGLILAMFATYPIHTYLSIS